MENKNIILVTGAHRSGSTWVGKMLSLGKGTGYAHEPFVLAHPNSPIKDWFFYVNDKLSDERKKEINAYMGRFFNPQISRLAYDVVHVRTIREIGRLIRDFIRHKKNQLFCKDIIVKDPIAILSTEWMQEKYNTKVVIVVRHPAAFAGSLKIGHWIHDFNHFLRQTELMDDLLDPHKDKIEAFSKEEKPIVEQAALLWNILYGTIFQLKEKHPEWIVITHDSLSISPLEEFKNLYQKLNLHFSEDVREKLESYVSRNDSNIDIKRDSKENLKTWKKRLTPDEISFMKTETEKVWKHCYTDSDW